jgi:16S rRNA (uracil1498-N3)-methyltransferase
VNRFFIEKINPLEKEVILNDPVQLHHLKDVLRIKLKEKVAIFDSLGNEYIVLVSQIEQAAIKFEIKDKKNTQESKIKITVACAIPKNVKMDDIVDKLTQLGVECIIPLETQRVIVKLDKQKKLARQIRWEKISLSALKQSQRSRFVKINPISAFKDVVICAKNYDLKLIPTLEDKRIGLRQVFNEDSGKIKNVIILIGPEGDFTPQEVAFAKASGFIPVNLGPGVLRVDTAAIAVASFIKLNEEY